MLALRFANGIFEPIWNRQFIDHVQITVAESIGIEGRAGYYEQAGAIRDIFQNHLLQLLAITAMEPPIDFTAESVRNEKVKVLKALHTPGPKHVVRGQYGRGFVEGEEVRALSRGGRRRARLDDRDVRRGEAVRRQLALGRHAVLRAHGQAARAPRDDDRDPVQARAASAVRGRSPAEGLRPNVLLIHVQPDEGVSLAIGAKVPGQGMTIRTVHMDFLYGGAFRDGLPDAYERLILDAMLGDATLFTRADEVEEQWALVDAIVACWQRDRPQFPNYAAGTWGPRVGRRAAPPRRPFLAAALWRADHRGRLDGRRRHDRRRSSASSRGCATRRDGDGAAEPAHVGDDAHRLGAGRVARRGGGDARRAWPSGIRRARSCSCRSPTSPTASTPQVSLRCFPLGDRADLRRGDRARRCAARARRRRRRSCCRCWSPTCRCFCRWRGQPPLARAEFEQLVDDRRPARRRLDGVGRLPRAYAALIELFDRTAVSDIAWARTGGWRAQLASLWPEIADEQAIHVRGTRARRTCCAPGSRSRLGPRDQAGGRGARELEGIDLDGKPAPFPPGDPPSAERRALRRARPLHARPDLRRSVRPPAAEPREPQGCVDSTQTGVNAARRRGRTCHERCCIACKSHR